MMFNSALSVVALKKVYCTRRKEKINKAHIGVFESRFLNNLAGCLNKPNIYATTKPGKSF